jgi:hypothetical protein
MRRAPAPRDEATAEPGATLPAVEHEPKVAARAAKPRLVVEPEAESPAAKPKPIPSAPERKAQPAAAPAVAAGGALLTSGCAPSTVVSADCYPSMT